MRVLFVDDEPRIRKAIARYWADLYEVHTAPCLIDARHLLAAHEYDVEPRRPSLRFGLSLPTRAGALQRLLLRRLVLRNRQR